MDEQELLKAARRGDAEWLRTQECDLVGEIEAYPFSLWAAAIEEDQVEVLNLCLAAGLDPSGTDESRPLNIAARSGAQKCFARLVAAGGDLTLADEDGVTPLLCATLAGQSEMVQTALEAGANPFEQNLTYFLPQAPKPLKDLIAQHQREAKSRMAPLMALYEQIQKCDGPIEVTAEQAETKVVTKQGATLLHFAARRNRVAALESMRAAGADLNHKDGAPHERKYGRGTTLEMCGVMGGRTPLMEAAEAGAEDAVHWLIAHGADVNAADAKGDTALHLACRDSNLAVVQALLDAGADVNARTEEEGTPLLIASYFSSAAVVEALITAGADVHAADQDGFTPLLGACWEGRTETVRVLMDHGVDPRATAGDEGDIWDALHLERRTKTLKFLLPHLDVNPEGRERSPLATAGEYSHWEAIPPMINAGARLRPGERVSVMGGWNSKPSAQIKALEALATIGHMPDERDLEQAVWKEDFSLIERMVQLGADPSPGLRAASSGKVVDKLIELGADVNARGVHGETALHAAVQHGAVGVVQRLLKAGADALATDEKGIRPVDLAQMGIPELKVAFAEFEPDGARVATLRLQAMLMDYEPPTREAVEEALLQGADPNLVLRPGVTALAAAYAWRKWDIADALVATGAQSTWESEVFARVQSLPEQAGPEFQADLEVLAQALGVAAEPVQGGFGAVSFNLKPLIEAREEELVTKGENCTAAHFLAGNQVPEEVAQRLRPLVRHSWCGTWRLHPVADEQILVVPTRDPYTVLALIQPRAGEHEVGVFEMLAFLRRYESLQWELTGVGYDVISLKFGRLPDDMEAWAKELYAFCPDLIDQGFEDLAQMVEHLRQHHALRFWWD